ncbi:MAG: ABC transporter ATP-binding protein [Clostridiales bacterium]|nr:ABC transporter ATP-binding protein [Clostridiales bacterium]
MGKQRTLQDLQRQYSKAPSSQGGPMMPGPGGRGPGGRQRGKPAKGKPKDTKHTIRRLWHYLSAYKGRLAVVVLCMMFSTFTSLAGSYMLRPIINNVADGSKTASARIGYLAMILLILGCIYAVGVLSTYLQGRMMLTISQNAVEKLRNDLFDKIQTLPVRYFDNNATGEIMSRFTNDIDNIDMMINNTITNLISGAVTLIGTFVMMVYTNIILTLITVAFVPIYLKAGMAIAARSSKYYGAQQAALGALNGYMEETVTGSKVIKVFNHEEVCGEEFKLLNEDMRDKQFKAQFYGGVVGPIMGNTSQISYAVTAGVGGVLCVLRGFDVGGLSVFCNYSRQFSQPISMISQQMSTIFAALAGAERVFSVMDLSPAAIDRPGDENAPTEKEETDALTETIHGDVALDQVTFGYNPDKTILKNISLYAHPGQKIAFVGSTGAGKTTITNLLNRFYDIESGQITIDGHDIKEYNRDHLRRNIAMVLQDTHLFTGTVMENIRYGRLDATDEEVMEAAKTASAHSFIMRLADGYQTMLEGDGANLSQGQRQLLNIARAALSKAPILVLDEATSSVDTRTERHIEHGMDRLMANRTTFVIAHRLSTVRNANAIMVLENGEIIERGSHEELLALQGRYYELYTGKKELD